MMPDVNLEAMAWSEAAFSASLIGVRSALERALLDLQGIAKTGGDVEGSRNALRSLLCEVELRAAAVPVTAGGPLPWRTEPRPVGLPPAPIF